MANLETMSLTPSACQSVNNVDLDLYQTETARALAHLKNLVAIARM